MDTPEKKSKTKVRGSWQYAAMWLLIDCALVLGLRLPTFSFLWFVLLISMFLEGRELVNRLDSRWRSIDAFTLRLSELGDVVTGAVALPEEFSEHGTPISYDMEFVVPAPGEDKWQNKWFSTYDATDLLRVKSVQRKLVNLAVRVQGFEISLEVPKAADRIRVHLAAQEGDRVSTN
jgi:hypothetical protein